ncbi:MULTISPECIES: GNAT family N-acetyltransferase [unclassified Modestobacter]|uniref:GNAT family N-acetyltransferase n=1 Tax=unclassified Modestobacter TaxID=2643866 RepID=UPI0022AA1279|nr:MULTISPECIES: GNAT family N-acetyltransferase [unclassified Modestobacter]MCZ2826772.1 GNAT family N-acetyltransferase [Modestobacter sp. VKM Ac-2981]MCZ2855152.1 GNAT family N-acetyltransferase [Modestobacter sp. VKM Ac-2982]
MGGVTDLIDATLLPLPATGPDQGVARAGAAAAAAAATEAAIASGVQVVALTDLADLRAVQTLFESIWHPAPDNPPVTVELMRALTKAGNPLFGAYAGPELVGACVGFFAAPSGTALHSHVTGVVPSAQRRSVGRALKLHQRAWALQRGLDRISWTFDPLVRRNAWFNLGRLAATPVEYLPDFYGPMGDTINASDQSDRLLTCWSLEAPAVVRAVAGHPVHVDLPALLGAGAAAVLAVGPDGSPQARPGVPGGTALIAVPPDVEALRARDPALAAEWRVAVRAALGGALTAGARVRGFAREGWYVVDGAGHPGAPEAGRATP